MAEPRRLEWTDLGGDYKWDTANNWRLEGIPGAVTPPGTGDTAIFSSGTGLGSDGPYVPPASAIILAEVIRKNGNQWAFSGVANISDATSLLTIQSLGTIATSGTWGTANITAGADLTSGTFTIVNMNHASASISGGTINTLNADAGCTQGGVIATANFRGSSRMQGGTVTGLLRWASSGIFTSESAAIVLSGCRIEAYANLSIEKSNLAVTGNASTRIVVMRRQVVVKVINVANGTYFPISVLEAYGFGPRLQPAA